MADEGLSAVRATDRALGRERFGALIAAFDGIVQAIYRAAAGLAAWSEPLQRFADASGAWAVTLGFLDKHARGARFGYAVGPRPAEADDEYVRKSHRIALRNADLLRAPVGKWISFDDRFDDDFAATNAYFPDFALRYGTRHLYLSITHNFSF
jgi:hypothetical protein